MNVRDLAPLFPSLGISPIHNENNLSSHAYLGKKLENKMATTEEIFFRKSRQYLSKDKNTKASSSEKIK